MFIRWDTAATDIINFEDIDLNFSRYYECRAWITVIQKSKYIDYSLFNDRYSYFKH